MIEKIFIVSFIVCGIWACFWESMIFGSFRRIGGKWPEWLQAPIFDCPVCMAPYYGTIIYWVALGNDWKEWIIVILSSLGLNAIFIKLFPPDIE